jgi:DNA mismatch repair protein MutS
LTDLADRLAGAQNYQITASERDGDVVFLHKLERGRASKSYGIEVARLAGMPAPMLKRAREVLAKLERYEIDIFSDVAVSKSGVPQAEAVSYGSENGEDILSRTAKRAARRKIVSQATLFDLANEHVLDELRNTKVETLLPEDARRLLSDLQSRLI